MTDTAPPPAFMDEAEIAPRRKPLGAVLGLDLARAWGWAVIASDGGYVASGHRKLAGTDRGEQAFYLHNAICDLLTTHRCDWIAIEKPHSPHYGASRNLFGYAMVAHLVAHARELGFVELARSECYAEVVGKGNARKVSAVMYVRDHYEPLCNSDDQADAVMVALTAHRRRGGITSAQLAGLG